MTMTLPIWPYQSKAEPLRLGDADLPPPLRQNRKWHNDTIKRISDDFKGRSMLLRRIQWSRARRAWRGIMILLVLAFAQSGAAHAMTPECRAAAAQAAYPTLAKWFLLITDHLTRSATRFPAAKRPQPQGRALVGFKINRSGVVLSAEILQSSGKADVDERALQYVRAAGPFPSPPSEYRESDAEFIVPIAFADTPKGKVSPLLFGSGQCLQAPRIQIPLEIKSADPNATLSTMDTATLAEQIAACLTTAPLAPLALKLRLNSDGSLSEPPSSEDRSEGGRYAAAIAVSDLLKCKPFKLTADSYQTWQRISVIYDPKAHAKLINAEARKSQRP